MSGDGAARDGESLGREGHGRVVIPDKLYYRIGEIEAITAVPAYVLRYWESEFRLLRPKKNPAGQRLYRRRDLDLVLRIKTLLYDERLTLEGAKKRLVAEYSLSGMAKPMGVAEYELVRALPKPLATCLPTIKELETELSRKQ